MEVFNDVLALVARIGPILFGTLVAMLLVFNAWAPVALGRGDLAELPTCMVLSQQRVMGDLLFLMMGAGIALGVGHSIFGRGLWDTEVVVFDVAMGPGYLLIGGPLALLGIGTMNITRNAILKSPSLLTRTEASFRRFLSYLCYIELPESKV